MFVMHVLTVVLLVSLALPVKGQIVQGEGQDFFTCDQHQCINETGVTCTDNNQCVCPPGQVGNARIQCADSDESCLCTVGGDPHLTTFDGQWFTLPLPCAHIIADITSGDCTVDIIGVALYDGNPPNPFAAFESLITIQVSAPNTAYNARINRNQVPVTSISHNSGESPGVEVREFKEDGLFCIEIPSCNLTIKYKNDTALFSVLTSLTQTTGAGLCGECGDDRPNPPVTLDQFQALRHQLLSSTILSQVEGINEYSACRDLGEVYQSCREDRKDFAVAFCGSALFQDSFQNCLYDQSQNVETLIEVFLRCVYAVCNQLTCSTYPDLLMGCTFDGMQDYLNNSTFCTNPNSG